MELEITGFSDVMPSKFELRGGKTSPSNKIDEYNYTQSCEQQQTDHKCLRMDFPLDSKPCSLSHCGNQSCLLKSGLEAREGRGK